jgi:long-chain acyl-CoA synthetase
MNICEHLTATARIFPDREAVCFEGTSFTYAQLDRLTIAAATQLIESGVQPGDRIAIMLPNVPAFVVWYYAALRTGAIAVSVSTRLAAAEVAYVVRDCDAKAVVTDEATLANIQDELPACVAKTFATSDVADRCNGQPLVPAAAENTSWVDRDPDDAALILYTSGTTGFAKGATLSHMNVRSNVHAFNHLCNMQPDDRMLLAVPLFHCFGQNALLNSALNVGATLILQRRFDLHEAKGLIAGQRVTQLYGVPMMFQLFLDSCEPADLATVNYCFSAAATLPRQVGERWQQKFGLPINEGYGLTETSPFASYNHRLQFVPGSIGTPIDAVEIKIVDTETGQPCAPGELGEIAIRGPNVMLGYWNREQDTNDAIRDGWFHSGDIGRVDERGYFYIVDRVKDMIAIGGLKVYPAEVERVLLDHAAVSEAAVAGIPNQVLGEQVVAFVVLADGLGNHPEQLAAIRGHAEQHLAGYKLPRTIVAIDELPRNPAGKVLKTKLRDYDLSAGDSAPVGDRASGENDSGLPAPTQLREPTLLQQLRSTHRAGRSRVVNLYLQELVQTMLQAEELPPADARFLDIGLDSLMIVELAGQLQLEVGDQHEFPATLVFDHPRICELAEYLVATLTDDAAAVTPTSPVTVGEPAQPDTSPRQPIESMSEAEAAAELLRELEG